MSGKDIHTFAPEFGKIILFPCTAKMFVDFGSFHRLKGSAGLDRGPRKGSLAEGRRDGDVDVEGCLAEKRFHRRGASDV